MNSTPIITAVTFEVAEVLVVSDPCYLAKAPDPEFEACAPGPWKGEIEYERGVIDARAVSVLRLSRGVMPLELHRVGNVGVDSGRMYAGCRSDLPLDYYGALVPALEEAEYADCIAFGGGIVCASGYGDGLYPVYADQDYTVVEVRFMEDVVEDIE